MKLRRCCTVDFSTFTNHIVPMALFAMMLMLAFIGGDTISRIDSINNHYSIVSHIASFMIEAGGGSLLASESIVNSIISSSMPWHGMARASMNQSSAVSHFHGGWLYTEYSIPTSTLFGLFH